MFKRIFILILFIFVAAFYARFEPRNEFLSAAADFPDGALIYARFKNLPDLIERWENSELRQKYLKSQNYRNFLNSHLALKLVERADEISSELNFFPDLSALSTLSETNAAMAVYDLGKMKFVIIAALSAEKAFATVLFENSDGFEEITLADGTKIYRREFEIDRGRQKMSVFFTFFRKRLIAATDEKLFKQTLELVKRNDGRDSLKANSAFQQLSAKITPHAATVWLDQAKLNDDWYFRHYWLMSDGENLQNLRGGIFDFEIAVDKIVERRIFLTSDAIRNDDFSKRTSADLLKFVPENVFYHRLRATNLDDTAQTVQSIFFKIEPEEKIITDSFDDNFETSDESDHWVSDFEKQIDAESVRQTNKNRSPQTPKNRQLTEIARIIEAPQLVEIFDPQNLSAPYFFKDRRAAIFPMPKKAEANLQQIEKNLSEYAKTRLTVGTRESVCEWTDVLIADFKARTCRLAYLGRQLIYLRTDKVLIFSNDEEILGQILQTVSKNVETAPNFDETAVINLTQSRRAYLNIWQRMRNFEFQTDEQTMTDFFTDNLGGLIDVIGEIEKIELQRSSKGQFIFEEIIFRKKIAD